MNEEYPIQVSLPVQCSTGGLHDVLAAMRLNTLRCWVHQGTADAAQWNSGGVVTIRSAAEGYVWAYIGMLYIGIEM